MSRKSSGTWSSCDVGAHGSGSSFPSQPHHNFSYEDIGAYDVWVWDLLYLQDWVQNDILEEIAQDLTMERCESDFTRFANSMFFEEEKIALYYGNTKIIKQVQELRGVEGFFPILDSLINNTKDMENFLVELERLMYVNRHYLVLPGFDGCKTVVGVDFNKLMNLSDQAPKQKIIPQLPQDRLGSVLINLASLNENLKKNDLRLSQNNQQIEFKKIPNLLRVNSLLWSILTALNHNLLSVTPDEDARGNKSLTCTNNSPSANYKTPVPLSRGIGGGSVGKKSVLRHVTFQLPKTPEELLGKDKENRNRNKKPIGAKGKKPSYLLSDTSVQGLINKPILVDSSLFFNSGGNSASGESTIVGSEPTIILTERSVADFTEIFPTETIIEGQAESTIIVNTTNTNS